MHLRPFDSNCFSVFIVKTFGLCLIKIYLYFTYIILSVERALKELSDDIYNSILTKMSLTPFWLSALAV